MVTMREFYYVSVSAPSDEVSYNYFCAAEKNELALSKTRRLCTIFSKSQAQFDSYEQAKEFLDTVKKKPNWEYEINQGRQYC